jgi:NodT family efflux transporter outer membrane factor (OMF) lipoprotein
MGGCTMVGPDFVKPEAPLADQWTQMDGPGLTEGEADYSAWWMAFNDPVLDRIIEKAYQQNLTLQVAGLRILQARAQLGIATGNLYPQKQLGFGEYATNQVSENMGTPMVDPRYESLSIGFDAAWELDVWGKFRRSVESGMAILEASIAGYDDILVSITAEVARSYIQIRTLEKRLEITRENVRIQKRSLELVETRYEGGDVSKLDVTQARSLLHNTQALIPTLESALRQTKNALAILLGILTGELEGVLGGSGEIPAVSDKIVVELPAELLRRRPDIRLAELRVAAQSPQIGVAKADLYPHFTLFGTIGWQATNTKFPGEDNSLNDIFSSKSVFWKAGPALSWDIFNYGRIKNRVRAEDARFQQTVVDYRNTVLKAQAEVEDAMVAFLRSQEEEKFLADSVESSKESVDLSMLQYEEGLVDFQRVLDTQRFLSTQSNRLTATSGRVSTNLVALYKALGGGWQIRIGKDIIDAETKEIMNARTDWGGLLDRKETQLPAPMENGEDRGKWRSPDW